MKVFKYFLVAVVCIALVNPTEAWRLRKAVKKLGRGIKKTVKKAGLKKLGCKLLFGVGCPLAVGAAGTAVGASTSGLGAALVGTGVAVGTKACHVRKNKCRRSVLNGEMLLPFSDRFNDYDMNGDKFISYEEFVVTVMTSVNLADTDELLEPFVIADANDDNRLAEDEFQGAPFLFAHLVQPAVASDPSTESYV